MLVIIALSAGVGMFFTFNKSNFPELPTKKTQEIENSLEGNKKTEKTANSSLVNICSMFSRNKAEIHQPMKPFLSASIWNRAIPTNAVYANVQDAIFGNPASSPRRVGVEIVTICYTDPSHPITNIEKSNGWDYPLRSQSSGKVLYKRQLSSTTCGCLNWKKDGNNLFVLIDPITNLADLGVGGWRIFGGPLLNVPNDGPTAHNIDVINGNGIIGYGRASSLPAIGGLIRPGELSNNIDHAVAVLMPASRFSSKRHFIWPAQSADSFARIIYKGTNNNYTIGTLLAIPHSIDINKMRWNTVQGFNLAKAAQKYGWYIVDTSEYSGDLFNIAGEDEAAYFDLGYNINPNTGQETIDSEKINIDGFTADMLQILSNMSAVTSNKP